jgi:sigma-B regulation protein RsbU (phosphoserine phosphatase)
LKLDIRRKVLFLVLSGSLLTFLLIAVFIGFGMNHARKTLDEQTEELIGDSVEYAAEMLEAGIKKHMEEITRARAQGINNGLTETVADVKYVASEMSDLLQKGVRFSAEPIPNALYTDVPAGKPFILYSPALIKQGISASLQKEIDRASGIAGLLVRMSGYYPNAFVGSKNGYFLMVQEKGGDDNAVSYFCKESIRNSYDARERSWYKMGIDVSEPVFTDAYIDTGTGDLCVSAVMSYYDADGFAGVVGLDCSIQDLYAQIMETAISRNEHSFILGKKGEVIVSSKKEGILSASRESPDLRQSGEPSLAREAVRMVEGKSDIKVVSVDGVEHYLAYAPLKLQGWSFGTLVEKKEVLAPATEAKSEMRSWMEGFRTKLREGFAGNTAALALAMVLLLAGFIAFSTWSAKRFVKPILELEDGVKQIARGNLDKTLSLQTGDEIEQLADSVNNMTAALKTYIADLSKVSAEKERIATELSVARNIQEGMLPKTFPAFPDKTEFDIYASMQAARQVGGDFYDFYLVDEDHLAVTIGDVSGKGVPAALFMVVARTVLQNNMLLLKKAEALGESMARANDRLCRNNEEDMFVTVFMGILNIRSGEFCYANAGHNRPLLRKGTAGLTWLPKADTCMMGLMEGMDFPVRKLQLKPGDCLFLYTDGVTEAMDEDGKLFSNEKLETLLGTIPADAAAKDILELVSEAVKAHAGNAEQSDDVTMLGLVYKG